MPPRVEYAGTRLADTLVPAFTALSEWSVQHLDDVMAARTKTREAKSA